MKSFVLLAFAAFSMTASAETFSSNDVFTGVKVYTCSYTVAPLGYEIHWSSDWRDFELKIQANTALSAATIGATQEAPLVREGDLIIMTRKSHRMVLLGASCK